MIAQAIALASLATWLTLVFARGNFWQARVRDDALEPLPAARARKIRVTAIVPARDEAQTVARCVTSLLKQDCAADFDVVMVDDLSTDGTGEAARAAAAAIGAEARLTVLHGAAPPPGWTGKLNAMRAGMEYVEGRMGVDREPPARSRANSEPAARFESGSEPAARVRGGASWSTPDYILFTDADIEHAPDVLARLVGGAEHDKLVLVSLMAQLACDSRAERWLVPAFVHFFAMLYPFAWVNDPKRATAAAAGGCMLVRREALARAGGLAAISDALIDDCALAAAMKKTGPIFLGLTHRVKSLRPYPRLADIRRMVVRSAYAELRYSPLRLIAATLGMALTFVAPAALAGHSDSTTGMIALAAYAMLVLSFRPMLRFYRLGSWRGLFLPIVALVYMAFTLESAYAHMRGRGGAWKGRAQAGATGSAGR